MATMKFTWTAAHLCHRPRTGCISVIFRHASPLSPKQRNIIRNRTVVIIVAGHAILAKKFLLSWPSLSRPSTTYFLECREDVDARDMRGHDESMLAGAAFTEVGDGLIGEMVEFAGLGITLDFPIEARGIDRLEPFAEFRELVGRQLRHGFFEVFDGHVKMYIILGPYSERTSMPAISHPSRAQ